MASIVAEALGAAPRAAIVARLGRWGGPCLAFAAGLALAYKPTYFLWGAGVPYVLDVYQQVAIGAADLALALIAAIGWLGGGRALPPAARALAWAGAALIACLAISAARGPAPPLAWAATARGALGLLAALGIARRPGIARWLLLGGLGALVAQVPFVALQLATQSTFPAGRLFDGRGELPAAMSGAAVIFGPGGSRWQRAIGTLPHPNILGGLAAVALVVGLPRLLRGGRHDRAARALWALGWLIVLLTASRAALLAALLGGGLVLLGSRGRAAGTRRSGYRQLARLAVPALAALAVAVALLGPAFVARLAVGPDSASVRERDLIAGLAAAMIRSQPLRGVGTGAFTLVELGPPFGGISVEPAHAIPLLVAAEAGIPAGLAWLALLAAPLAAEWRQARRLSPARLAFPATLLTLALLDHYLWTFGTGRAIWWLGLGVWLAGWQGQRFEGAGRQTEQRPPPPPLFKPWDLPTFEPSNAEPTRPS